MVTIEPIIYTVRIGKENFKFGDPYTSVCTATKISPDTVRITALAGGITTEQAKIIFKEFIKLGFKHIVWERKKDDEYKNVSTNDYRKENETITNST